MMQAWDAEDYRANAQAQLTIGGDFLDRVVLAAGARVLDVGCGDGRVTARVAARVPEGAVVGVDPSAEMIAFARRAHPELTFAVADVRDLAYDAEFAAVVSFSALHWVVDGHDRALAAMRRALVPGGLLATTFPGAGNIAALIAAADAVNREARWAPFFAGFAFPWYFPTAEAYARRVAAAGLVAERIELVPRDVVHASPAALAGWIRTSWMPYTHRVPPTDRAAWIDAVVARADAVLGRDAEGCLRVPSFRLEVEARRPEAD